MIKLGNEVTKSAPRFYSLAFKKKVVQEVESGQLTKAEARNKYNIGGKMTVLKWCRKYGKLYNLGLQVNISMITENDEKESLKRRIRLLEEALSNAHLKIESQELMISLAEEKYSIEIRKKTGTKQPN